MRRQKGETGPIRVRDKRTPHHSLLRAKELIKSGHYTITLTATITALRDFAGLTGPTQVADCVLMLERSDFYKSMTTLRSYREWQDVYHKTISGKEAYIKIQIESSPKEQTVIISFKRRED